MNSNCNGSRCGSAGSIELKTTIAPEANVPSSLSTPSNADYSPIVQAMTTMANAAAAIATPAAAAGIGGSGSSTPAGNGHSENFEFRNNFTFCRTTIQCIQPPIGPFPNSKPRQCGRRLFFAGNRESTPIRETISHSGRD